MIFRAQVVIENTQIDNWREFIFQKSPTFYCHLKLLFAQIMGISKLPKKNYFLIRRHRFR